MDWNRFDIYEKVVQWFEVIAGVLQNPEVLPENVYNMDETGVMLSKLNSVRVIMDKTNRHGCRGACLGEVHYVLSNHSITQSSVSLLLRRYAMFCQVMLPKPLERAKGPRTRAAENLSILPSNVWFLRSRNVGAWLGFYRRLSLRSLLLRQALSDKVKTTQRMTRGKVSFETYMIRKGPGTLVFRTNQLHANVVRLAWRQEDRALHRDPHQRLRPGISPRVHRYFRQILPHPAQSIRVVQIVFGDSCGNVLARRVMVCIDWMNVVCRILKHH
jgi:hypothetical protein